MLHTYLSLYCSFYVQRHHNENQHTWNVERYLMKKLSIFIYRIRPIVLLAFKIPNILISCNCTYTTWPINLPLPLYPSSSQGNVQALLFVLTQQWSSHLLILCTPMPSAVPHRYLPHSFTTDCPHRGQGDMLDARKRYKDNSKILCIKDLITLD